jgi:superfamily II DNA or RNA helicase
MALHLAFFEDGLASWGSAASGGATVALADAELRAELAKLLPGKAAERAEARNAVAWLPAGAAGPVAEERAHVRLSGEGRDLALRAQPVAALLLARRDSIELLARVANDLDRRSDAELAAAGGPSPDVRWFAHALRFVARLVLDGRFVPGAEGDPTTLRSKWQPVLRDEEHALVAALGASLPAAARALSSIDATAPPRDDPRALARRFISEALDTLVRMGANEARQLGFGPTARVRSQHDAWIRSLLSFDRAIALHKDGGDPLPQEVATWQRPLELSADAPVRLVFRLEEPEGDEGPWTLRFLLRATDDPSLLVPLADVLDGKAKGPAAKGGAAARELTLVALGQAAAVSPLLAIAIGSAPRGAIALSLDQAHEFLTHDALALETAGFSVLLPRWWLQRSGRQPLKVRGKLRGTFAGGTGALSLNDLVTVDWEVALGDQALSAAELQALAKQKKPLVRLRGQWVELDPEQLQDALDKWKRQSSTTARVREMVHLALGIDDGERAPLPVAAIEGSGLFGELFDGLSSKERFKELPTPATFVGELRPYQKRGWSWLKFLRRFGLPACLADDMGLGKTIQALALLTDERANGETRPVLLVCPTSLVGNWQREAARFAPNLEVMVHHGLDRQRDQEFVRAAQRHALVVTTYSLLSRDGDVLASMPWSGVILDEAQNVKNPDTKQARAARRLSAEWRVVMTGTPVENHVGDLWSLFQFLSPDLLPPREQFHREFLMPIRVGRDEAALARLKRRTGPFILRRLKSDPAILPDLPPKLEHKVICNLTREQATLYAAVVDEMTDRVRSATGMQRRGAILAGLTKLKQVCNHPVHLLGDGTALPDRSGKLERATEMLAEVVEVGDRALVFTQFREMGDLLQRHFATQLGCEVAFLHGGTPRDERQELVDRFQQENDGPPIFVLSLRAGGTGLNLTRASHVFHYDRWWNPAVESQATDRAHRIGQTRQLQVHLLVCAGTLEERIDKLLERKKEVAEQVVGSGEQWLTELSTEQLRDLVSLDDEAVAE